LLTFGFVALVIVAASLRLVQSNESLWIDELHTAWTVDAGLSRILSRAGQGNYSPLYFLLPWLSTRVFGMHEWSLRLPSLLAGIVLVPVCFVIARQWFRSRAIACLAAVLVTLDPHLLFYSLDARPYAIVQLGAVLHIWLLSRLLQARRSVGEQTAYCLLGIALVYMHYTSALLLVAEFTFSLIWLVISHDRQVFHRTSICHAVMASGCLPSVFAVRTIAARRGLWNQFVPQQNNLLEIFPLSTYLYAAAGAMAAIATVRLLWRKTPILDYGKSNDLCTGHKFHALMLLLVCWLFVPLIIAWQTTRIDLARLFFRRYLMFSYCAMILLTCGLGVLCPSRRARLTFALLVAAVTGYSLGPWRQFQQDGRVVRHSHEDWRGAVAAVNRDAGNKDAGRTQPIFVRAGLIEESLLSSSADVEASRDYLLLPVSSLYKIKGSSELLYPLTANPDIKLPQNLLEQVQAGGGCWLVVRGRDWVDQNGANLVRAIHDDLRMEQPSFFGNVAVLRCQITN
jgi:hypothetical protein